MESFKKVADFLTQHLRQLDTLPKSYAVNKIFWDAIALKVYKETSVDATGEICNWTWKQLKTEAAKNVEMSVLQTAAKKPGATIEDPSLSLYKDTWSYRDAMRFYVPSSIKSFYAELVQANASVVGANSEVVQIFEVSGSDDSVNSSPPQQAAHKRNRQTVRTVKTTIQNKRIRNVKTEFRMFGEHLKGFGCVVHRETIALLFAADFRDAIGVATITIDKLDGILNDAAKNLSILKELCPDTFDKYANAEKLAPSTAVKEQIIHLSKAITRHGSALLGRASL